MEKDKFGLFAINLSCKVTNDVKKSDGARNLYHLLKLFNIVCNLAT